ncbi:MAG: hypothetical protein ACRDHM_05885 [Actinomycetota bacterium]
MPSPTVESEEGGESPPPGLPGGTLLFSRFDESSHSLVSTGLIRPDGTAEGDLTWPNPEPGGRWSRDGSRIAVVTILDDELPGTMILEADGTVDHVLEVPDTGLRLVCTVWSPDDKRLACEGFDDADPAKNGLYTVALDGGDVQRLTSAPDGTHDIPGDYSPDGLQIVFKRTTDEDPGPLMLVDTTGGRPRPLSHTEYEDPGRFSPDGKTILTARGGTVETVDLDGKITGTISDAEGYFFGAVWSPDGEWIAYSRFVGSPFSEIFISRPDGSEVWQVTHTPGDNEINIDWGPEP